MTLRFVAVVLVTGSNMSGSTTFIRAIGLNLLSAQVFHTCFARSFRFPMDAALFSAIHLEDSLMEGKSFFLQEVQIVREMLEVGKGREGSFSCWMSCSKGRIWWKGCYSESCAICFGTQEQYRVCFLLTTLNWLPYLRTNMNRFIFVNVLPTIPCLLIIS